MVGGQDHLFGDGEGREAGPPNHHDGEVVSDE